MLRLFIPLCLTVQGASGLSHCQVHCPPWHLCCSWRYNHSHFLPLFPPHIFCSWTIYSDFIDSSRNIYSLTFKPFPLTHFYLPANHCSFIQYLSFTRNSFNNFHSLLRCYHPRGKNISLLFIDLIHFYSARICPGTQAPDPSNFCAVSVCFTFPRIHFQSLMEAHWFCIPHPWLTCPPAQNNYWTLLSRASSSPAVQCAFHQHRQPGLHTSPTLTLTATQAATHMTPQVEDGLIAKDSGSGT